MKPREKDKAWGGKRYKRDERRKRSDSNEMEKVIMMGNLRRQQNME